MQSDSEENSVSITGHSIAATVWATLAAGLLGCVLLGSLGHAFWALDLLNHFQLQYFALGILGAALGLLLRARLAIVLFVAAAGLSGARLLPLFWAPAQETRTGMKELRVLALNVLTGNTDPEKAIQWILSEDADVLVLQEINETWAQRLELPLSRYVRLETGTVREDNFGLSVYVKPGIEVGATTILPAPADLPWIDVELTKDGRSLHLFAVHTLPPMGSANSRMRDEHLAAIALRASAKPGPVVVAGDLNATLWSAPLAEILKTGDLRSAGLGQGLQGTWPSALWFTGMIPIDHVLVSKDVNVTDFRVSTKTGSDHRGIVANLAY